MSRREFLTAAASGAAVAAVGRVGLTRAATLPLLRSEAGGTTSGGIQRFRSRPDLLAPEIVIDTPAQAPLGGLVVTESHLGAPQSGPLILDQSGRMIWFSPIAADPASPVRAFNARMQHYGGRPVLSWFQGVVAGSHGVGYGQGHYEIVDTSYRRVAQVFAHSGYQGDLHEFLLTPDGTAIFTCYGQAEARLRIGGAVRRVPYLFGVVQEVDVATGKLLWQWRSDRHVRLTESYRQPVLKPGWVWDYLHINSISLDPHDQNLVISGRNTCACYKVNRRTGTIMWRLGGKHSDFRMGPGTRFNFQHDVNIHPGDLLTLFDNEGGPPQEAAQSRALVLSIDQSRKRVRMRHAFHHQPSVYSDALGSVQPLGGGNWFVGWGRSTAFTQYSSAGEVLFDGHLSPGSSSYRAFLQPWAGAPAARPDVALTRTGSSATVYASWNGSTGVAQWKVLGGAGPATLAPLGMAPNAGFETAISLAWAPAYLAVAACDAAGRILSTSLTASDS